MIRRRSLRTGDGPLDTQTAAERYESDRPVRRREHRRRDRVRSGGGRGLEVSTVEGHAVFLLRLSRLERSRGSRMDSSHPGRILLDRTSSTREHDPPGRFTPSSTSERGRSRPGSSGRPIEEDEFEFRQRAVGQPSPPAFPAFLRFAPERLGFSSVASGGPIICDLRVTVPVPARPRGRVARGVARGPRSTRGAVRSRARRTRSSSPGTPPPLPGTEARAARARVGSPG